MYIEYNNTYFRKIEKLVFIVYMNKILKGGINLNYRKLEKYIEFITTKIKIAFKEKNILIMVIN